MDAPISILCRVERLTAEYSNNRKTAVNILEFIRASGTYGFPVVCSLSRESERERLIWAKRLLLNSCGIVHVKDSDEELIAKVLAADRSILHEDAQLLLSTSTGNAAWMTLD